MSAFLIYLTCSFLFIIFYITRDEIRRARITGMATGNIEPKLN